MRAYSSLLTLLLAAPSLAGFHVVEVHPPTGAPKADLVFFTGHADRAENHRTLFEKLALEASARTLSFDWPEHGETQARSLDSYSLAELRAVGVNLLKERGIDGRSRPLLLGGWSFGGLMSLRLLQRLGAEAPGLKISGLLLLSPAIAPRPFPGGAGKARWETLSHDLARIDGPEPKPARPLSTPFFALRLLAEAFLLRQDRTIVLPPTLAILADPELDLYVDNLEGRSWLTAHGAMTIRTCEGAYHALDLETPEVSASVLGLAVRWVQSYLLKREGSLHLPGCASLPKERRW